MYFFKNNVDYSSFFVISEAWSLACSCQYAQKVDTTSQLIVKNATKRRIIHRPIFCEWGDKSYT